MMINIAKQARNNQLLNFDSQGQPHSKGSKNIQFGEWDLIPALITMSRVRPILSQKFLCNLQPIRTWNQHETTQTCNSKQKKRNLIIWVAFVSLSWVNAVSIKPFEILKMAPWLPWVPLQMSGWNHQPISAPPSRLRWDSWSASSEHLLIPSNQRASAFWDWAEGRCTRKS